jgi:hypothetical protein
MPLVNGARCEATGIHMPAPLRGLGMASAGGSGMAPAVTPPAPNVSPVDWGNGNDYIAVSGLRPGVYARERGKWV